MCGIRRRPAEKTKLRNRTPGLRILLQEGSSHRHLDGARVTPQDATSTRLRRKGRPLRPRMRTQAELRELAARAAATTIDRGCSRKKRQKNLRRSWSITIQMARDPTSNSFK